jgi:Cdc6-like AAA superfamily ATPase
MPDSHPLTDDQQKRLIFEVSRVFTPSGPIKKLELFAGRTEEIAKIADCVNSVGKHAIVYGERGVGKTSLAAILEDHFKGQDDIRISRINCETNDTFPSVWDKSLAEIPIDEEQSRHVDQPGKADAGQWHQHFTLNQWLLLDQYVGPGQIKKALQKGNEHIRELVLVFDEFNELGPEHRAMFAHTIKDLADNHIGATIVLVGVAKNITDLIENHASVSRSLAEIPMPPMLRWEIKRIIDTGLKKLKMTMYPDGVETIATLAQGYAHYAHLLGKESALAAIRDRRLEINGGDIDMAIDKALADNSYNVVDEYAKATQAQRKGTLFEQVLISAALAEVDELGFFASTGVRPVLNAITKENYEIYGFSQHLEKFSAEEKRGPVFEKRGSKRCYRYRYLNPLLRPYAIMKGMADGLVDNEMLQRLANPPPKSAKTQRPRAVPKPKHSSEPNLFEPQS